MVSENVYWLWGPFLYGAIWNEMQIHVQAFQLGTADKYWMLCHWWEFGIHYCKYSSVLQKEGNGTELKERGNDVNEANKWNRLPIDLKIE